MPLQVERIHLIFGDFDTCGVVVGHQMGLHVEAGLRTGLLNIVQCEIKGAQGTTSPRLADFAEEPMLHRIPLGGAGRIVTDRDG